MSLRRQIIDTVQMERPGSYGRQHFCLERNVMGVLLKLHRILHTIENTFSIRKMLSKLGIRKANVEKVPLEAPHVTNDLDQAVLKLIQVMNQGEE